MSGADWEPLNPFESDYWRGKRDAEKRFEEMRRQEDDMRRRQEEIRRSVEMMNEEKRLRDAASRLFPDSYR